MSFTTFLLQTAAGAAEGGAAGGLGMLIPLVLIVVIMYFFMIRPQNKKQKETQKMLDALKKGDKVITIGGIHGVVSQVKDQTVVVKVDDGAKIEFNRTAIATVVTDKPAASKDADAKKEKKSLFGRKSKAVEAEKSEPAAEEKVEKAETAEVAAESDAGDKKDE